MLYDDFNDRHATEIYLAHERINETRAELNQIYEEVDQRLRVVESVTTIGDTKGYAVADSFNEYARSVVHGLNRLFKEKFEAGEFEISDEEFDKIISAEEYRLFPW